MHRNVCIRREQTSVSRKILWWIQSAIRSSIGRQQIQRHRQTDAGNKSPLGRHCQPTRAEYSYSSTRNQDSDKTAKSNSETTHRCVSYTPSPRLESETCVTGYAPAIRHTSPGDSRSISDHVRRKPYEWLSPIKIYRQSRIR